MDRLNLWLFSIVFRDDLDNLELQYKKEKSKSKFYHTLYDKLDNAVINYLVEPVSILENKKQLGRVYIDCKVAKDNFDG